MKRSLVVLLSLAFVMAFSVSAFAVTADFTGQYYVNGRYFESPTLLEQNSAAKTRTGPESYAGLDSRLRLFTRFKLAEGLTLTTRADIMETHWGQDTKIAPWVATGRGWVSAANQSINVEQTWMTFTTGIGTIAAGYKSARPFGWGTAFMNSTGTNPGLEWSMNFGPARVFVDWYKVAKGNLAATTGSSWVNADFTKGADLDTDMYDVGAFYRTKTMDTGLMVSYIRDASAKAGAAGTLLTVAAIQPYYKGKLGPVDLEAEAYWFTGKIKGETAAVTDVDVDTKGIMLNAKFNIGPAYVGGIFLYNSGDDRSTADKREGDMNSPLGGFNKDKGNGFWGDFVTINQGYHYHDYIPRAGDTSSFDSGSTIDNLWLYQIYGGMAIGKKLDFQTRFSIMKADQDGGGTAARPWLSKDYGKEFDFLVTYKIFDQLTYNVGAAYLWTGDWYKGTNTAAPIKNAYYLLHYLDLNF